MIEGETRQQGYLDGVTEMSAELQHEKRFSEKQFCEMYGINRDTARRWRDARLISFIRLPTGKIFYKQSHIDEFERRNEKKAHGRSIPAQAIPRPAAA